MDKYRKALFDYISDDRETQRATAERLGVSEGTLSRWLSGSTRIIGKYHQRIEKLTRLPLSKMPDSNCPLADGHCPVFANAEINHSTALIFAMIKSLSPQKQDKLLVYLKRLSKKE